MEKLEKHWYRKPNRCNRYPFWFFFFQIQWRNKEANFSYNSSRKGVGGRRRRRRSKTSRRDWGKCGLKPKRPFNRKPTSSQYWSTVSWKRACWRWPAPHARFLRKDLLWKIIRFSCAAYGWHGYGEGGSNNVKTVFYVLFTTSNNFWDELLNSFVTLLYLFSVRTPCSKDFIRCFF